MDKYPDIIFDVDPNEDIRNCLSFLREEKKYLKNFFPTHLHFILDPTFSEKERKKIATVFTTHAHQQYSQQMRKTLSKIKLSWQKISPQFFALCEQIFDHHPWPAGEYHGYATIFCCFPRYLERRTFFLPVVIGQLPLQIIAHEMLHFIFFDYLKHYFNLTGKSSIQGKSKNFVWEFSEAFNNVIENWPPYAKIFDTKGNKYFDSKVNKLAIKLSKKWSQKQDINHLITSYLSK